MKSYILFEHNFSVITNFHLKKICFSDDQGYGRGGGQRGRGGGSNRRQRGYEPDDEPVVRWDQGVDVFDNGHGVIANGQNVQPAKNSNSEQVNMNYSSF